ncbi:hypothetical protein [Nocardia sp. NPDC004415]
MEERVEDLTRDFCEFLAEVVVSDSILGLQNGASVSSVDEMMGDSVFREEIHRKGAWMRRDYGLVEMNFNPDAERLWVCFGVHLRVHRLRWGTAIPRPIAERVPDIPGEVRFVELCAAVKPLGELRVRQDRVYDDSRRYVSESGAEVVVVSGDSGGAVGSDQVWSVDLSTRL